MYRIVHLQANDCCHQKKKWKHRDKGSHEGAHDQRN